MALPKYKKLKTSIEKMLAEEFSNVSKEQLGPFKDSPRVLQHEGKIMRHNTLDNTAEESDMDFKRMGVEYSIKYDEMPNYTPERVILLVHEKAREMGTEMSKFNFQIVNKAIERVGNSVDATGMKIGPEAMIKAFEKISISFDKNGKAHMPTMVVSPKNSEEWLAAAKELDQDAELRMRMEDLMKKKKEEHDAEQASRKLVD